MITRDSDASKKFLPDSNIFQRISVIGSHQSIAKIPWIFSKQIVVHFKADRTQIFDDEHRRRSGVAFTKGMVLPQQRDEINNVIDDSICGQPPIID